METVLGFIVSLTLWWLILPVNAPQPHENEIILGENETKSIYEFWKSQDKLFVLGPQRDIVLLLGNTGSGKSTTALFITGNANLRSVETYNGSEQFYITDDADRIGRETIKSHTLIPELMIDPKTGTAYYDCPGFVDTRSAAHDITIAYFLNKLMSHATAVKLVFVVSYSSVIQNEDRVSFLGLVRNAVNLIKSVETYSDGIALVVTKVDTISSDRVVIERIANFLREVHGSLTNLSKTTHQLPEMRKLNGESIKFVETLLEKRNYSYERIGIFRRAEKAAPIINIPTLQSERARLETIIHENIKFVRRRSYDFGFVISPESRTVTIALIDEIVRTAFVADVLSLCREVNDSFRKMEQLHADIDHLREQMKEAQRMLSDIVDECPRQFLHQILNVIHRLNVSVSVEIVQSMRRHIRYIDFLTQVNNQTLATSLPLAKALSRTVNYMENGRRWYDFLIELRKKLSMSDLQNYDMKRIARDVTNVIRRKELVQQTRVADMGLNELLDIDSDVEAIEVHSHQMKALENVLAEYSTDALNITCTPDELNMTVMGRVIKTSDVVKENCYLNATFIEIFALNTLIVDADIDKNEQQAQIVMIAPTWEVIGDRRVISSNGTDGKSHLEAAAANGKGTNGHPNNGQDGQPGLPGGAGGSFVAVGGEFINGRNLEIQMNGGDAGPAQHGGNGSLAIEGTDPPITSDCDPTKLWYDDKFIYSSMHSPSQWETSEIYVVYGKNGTKPGDGGNGGKQGYGGHAGKILLFELSKASQFATYANEGSVGLMGKGGISVGNGTRNGRTYHVKITLHLAAETRGGGCTIRNIKTIDKGRTEAGTNGTDNFSDVGRSPQPAHFRRLSFSLNKYKSYVREQLVGSTRERALKLFLDTFTNHEQIKLQYDTLGLVDELLTLENHFFRLQHNISFVPLLESLLDRAAEHSQRNAAQMTGEQKKVLSYLHTAALSQICGIKDQVNNNTIYDLEEFLQLVESNIKKLRESVTDDRINAIRTEYKSSLDEKVRSANDFIETQMIPEIDNIFRQIDDAITSLIDELLQKQIETTKAFAEQKKRRRELVKQLSLRKHLGPLKIIASMLLFFGPIGAGVGATIGGATMLYEALALDGTSGKGIDRIGVLVSPDFKASMSRIQDLVKQRPEQIRQKIYDLDNYLKGGPENVTDVTDSEIWAIKEKVKKCKEDVDKLKVGEDNLQPFVVRLWRDAEKELIVLTKEAKEKLEKRQIQLSKQDQEAKIRVEKQLRMVSYVHAIVNVGDVSVQLYNQIRNDEAKLQIVSDYIAEEEGNLNVLLEHEAKIYEILIPMFRQTEKTVDNVSIGLAGNVHVELEVKKWNIRRTLSDVRLLFDQMSSGFVVHDILYLSIQKVDKGMATLINVYDRIDSYADSLKLATYIADINSKNSIEIEVHDFELSAAVTSLQKIIRSNLVLEQHGMAVHATKQRYFPLARFYIDDLKLPDSLRMDDTSSLIEKSIDQVTDLATKIKTRKSQSNLFGASLYSGVYFDGGIGSQPPFYVWKSFKIKNEMKKLLQGQPITLHADVVDGVNQNAIKFNDIGIRMKLVVATTSQQAELETELGNFRVSMTMVGNNYYRCDSRYYSISLDRNVDIDMTFAKTADGDLKERNDPFKRIRENDPFLSPYAMWIIRLTQLDHSISDFRGLSKFFNENIDLELVGRGQYLKHGTFSTDICNDRLDQYYNLDRIVSSNVECQIL